MQLGDARTGKLADNVTGFGRALRRAGVRLDSARIALAQQAALLVGVGSKGDLSAAMEAVLVSREQDRMVFRELFDIYFRNPEVANKLLSQLLPSAEGKAEPSKRRPRVREALAAMASRESDLRMWLLNGSYSQYQRATQRCPCGSASQGLMPRALRRCR